jgi:hypothetical protein
MKKIVIAGIIGAFVGLLVGYFYEKYAGLPAFIGYSFLIGAFIGSSEGIADLNIKRILYGSIVGTLSIFLGYLFGALIYRVWNRNIGFLFIFISMWSIFGFSVGVKDVFIGDSLKKSFYRGFAGVIGGIICGVIFLFICFRYGGTSTIKTGILAGMITSTIIWTCILLGEKIYIRYNNK